MKGILNTVQEVQDTLSTNLYCSDHLQCLTLLCSPLGVGLTAKCACVTADKVMTDAFRHMVFFDSPICSYTCKERVEPMGDGGRVFRISSKHREGDRDPPNAEKAG